MYRHPIIALTTLLNVFFKYVLGFFIKYAFLLGYRLMIIKARRINDKSALILENLYAFLKVEVAPRTCCFVSNNMWHWKVAI